MALAICWGLVSSSGVKGATEGSDAGMLMQMLLVRVVEALTAVNHSQELARYLRAIVPSDWFCLLLPRLTLIPQPTRRVVFEQAVAAAAAAAADPYFSAAGARRDVAWWHIPVIGQRHVPHLLRMRS